MDDVIIQSQDEEKDIENLKRLLTICAEYALNINFKKCQFLKVYPFVKL